MEAGQRNYGVSDLEYDIMMTLSNLLQGEEALAKYQKDAQEAGDQDCARIFQQIRDQNRLFVGQLRQALAKAMGSGK